MIVIVSSSKLKTSATLVLNPRQLTAYHQYNINIYTLQMI